VTRHILTSLAFLALAGCGPAAEPEASASPEAPAEEEVSSGGEEAQEPSVYEPNPVLNVYVQGPNPVPGEVAAGTPDDFRASIVVSNTGDDPAEVRFAYIEFELRTASGEIVECAEPAAQEPVEGPEALGPGESYTYEAAFHCAPPGPGEYDVWVYLSFGAEITADADRARFTAGHYPLHVR
jgi:hypothetical protein